MADRVVHLTVGVEEGVEPSLVLALWSALERAGLASRVEVARVSAVEVAIWLHGVPEECLAETSAAASRTVRYGAARLGLRPPRVGVRTATPGDVG